MTPKEFVRRLSDIHTPNSFNPYSEVCSVYDVKDASKIRRSLLFNMLLRASKVDVDAIWIGRDLGHRGGRRTGLALTDEAHAAAHASRWSLSMERTTKGEVTKEQTASVIWGMLNQIEDNIFLWNVFPLHPHEEGNPFTNRSHNTKERRIGEEILFNLMEMIAPRKIIAIGNDASSFGEKMSDRVPFLKVRHPSYGGQNIFIDQISEVYGVERYSVQQKLF